MSKQLLDVLLNERLLDEKSYQTLLNKVRPADKTAWLSHRLLAAGVAFILAGFVCFIAANWQEMGLILRLSLPLIGLVLCGAGAYYKKLDTWPGQGFAFGAAVMIGAFLAVFGQIYQTGAFLYELFGLWALLLLPLCWLTRNKWMYLFALYVATVYWGSFQGGILTDGFWWVALGVYFTAWALVEFLPACKNWGEGFKRFIWMPLSVYATVWGGFSAEKVLNFPNAGYYLAGLVLAGIFLGYAHHKKDVALFAWNALALTGLICAYLYQWLGFCTLGLLIYCLLFAGSGIVSYRLWFSVREEIK